MARPEGSIIFLKEASQANAVGVLHDTEPLKIQPIIEFQIYRSKSWSEPIGKIVVVIH